MDHFREIKNKLAWHNEGKFEAELTNGVITRLNFCEPGKGPDDVGKCLTSTNYKYLQAVYSSLGDLFQFIDEENKRLGYKYAQHVDIPTYHQENIDELYQATETKMRPLINYDQLQETAAVNTLTEDIGHQDIELTA